MIFCGHTVSYDYQASSVFSSAYSEVATGDQDPLRSLVETCRHGW
jgi:hypothetical protein